MFNSGRLPAEMMNQFQDLFLVLSMTMMLMTFFSTYLFQAGLVEAVLRRLGAAACAGGVYLAACAALHAAGLLLHAPAPAGARAESEPLRAALFALQRCLAPWYYFLYKRAALRVSDPRFYEDVDWISRQLQPPHPRPR